MFLFYKDLYRVALKALIISILSGKLIRDFSCRFFICRSRLLREARNIMDCININCCLLCLGDFGLFCRLIFILFGSGFALLDLRIICRVESAILFAQLRVNFKILQ